MSFRQEFRQCQALNGWNTSKLSIRKGFKLFISLCAGLMLSIISTTVFAQNDEAAAIKIGESNFIPSVRFEYFQTDNAFLEDTESTETTAVVIKPRANWTADRRLLRLTGIYEGAYASFEEEALNYADHSLRAILDAELSSRQRARARIAFNFGHQALGTGLTLNATDNNVSQIEFLNTELQGSYLYGASQARGNIQLGLNLSSRSYQNEKTLTAGYDFTSVRPFGRFSLRLSSDTRAIATVRFTNVTYDESNRDRDDISLLAGLSFDATGKTGGEFQLGSSLTQFGRSAIADKTSFVAEADLFFEPAVFSRFELTAARVLDNNAGISNLSTPLSITDSVNLNWEHEWSSRFYHVADLAYRIENGDCPASRNDTVTKASGGIELNLVLRRWLHVGASISGESREASSCTNAEINTETIDNELRYESQIFGAHIRATL